jgi:hypothetical protein
MLITELGITIERINGGLEVNFDLLGNVTGHGRHHHSADARARPAWQVLHVADKRGMISQVLELVKIEGILLHQVGDTGNVDLFKPGLLIRLGNKEPLKVGLRERLTPFPVGRRITRELVVTETERVSGGLTATRRVIQEIMQGLLGGS